MIRPLLFTTLGGLWTLLMAFSVGVILTLIGGQALTPAYGVWLLSGLISGGGFHFFTIQDKWMRILTLAGLLITVISILSLAQPFGLPLSQAPWGSGLGLVLVGLSVGVCLTFILQALGPTPAAAINRFRIEAVLSHFICSFGLLFFAFIVTVPLYLMVAGSLYATPSGDRHDFAALGGVAKSILDPFRSYYNLFAANDSALASNLFGQYFFNSIWVSLGTVVLTLMLAVPGAYAISRLSFPGQSVLSRSILLIYLVPVIVLVIPLFVMLTRLGLTNSWGLLLVYPATTLPVALYMLQGYFRGLPVELEEAGLMDGCSRLRVIWSITIPLALPAIASVALYVFMIAWNEFLIAFMLLNDTAHFTLPIGINSMNSSEVAEQDLMAAAVVTTVPIVVLFLWAERFIVQGLTSGGVKG